MFESNKRHVLIWILLFAWFGLAMTGCGPGNQTGTDPQVLNVPRGYVSVLEIEKEDRLLGFGPFVGYYFKPETPDDLDLVHFVCFNERSFYSSDMPANSKLFEGIAKLTDLADTGKALPDNDRINPIFFPEAPSQWLESQPEPKDEFVHFHSCYDARGPVLTGYWFLHVATAAFTYDMGGRVGPDSPLFHKVLPGLDKAFAYIIEFDRGPTKRTTSLYR